MTMPTRNRIITGDALAELRSLPSASVDMVLTSPPYFRLRNYGVDRQLGQELTVAEWTAGLQAVVREVHRVLVPTGTLWLNLGDSYAGHHRQGAGRKSLLLGPERLALDLIADGWLLRNKIVWQKTNPMPSPVKDRLSCTWETVYVLTKQPDYFFDLDAVRLPHRSRPATPKTVHRERQENWRGSNAVGRTGLLALSAAGRAGHPLGKNPGDVWAIGGSGYRGPHPATFPFALAERAIMAGCPELRCALCRRPWRRTTARPRPDQAERGDLRPTCACPESPEPGLVLDPFMGVGTTAVAAARLERDWLGIELNPAFAAEALARVERAPPQQARAA